MSWKTPKHAARKNSPISTIPYWSKHAVDEVEKVKWGKKESSCQEVADFQVKGKKANISFRYKPLCAFWRLFVFICFLHILLFQKTQNITLAISDRNNGL